MHLHPVAGAKPDASLGLSRKCVPIETIQLTFSLFQMSQARSSEQVYATLSRQVRRMSLPNIAQSQKSTQINGQYKSALPHLNSTDDGGSNHHPECDSSSSASQGWLRGNILRAFRRSKPRPKSIAVGYSDELYANHGASQQQPTTGKHQQSSSPSNPPSSGNFYLGAEMISLLQRQLAQKDDYIRQIQMESSRNLQQLESLKAALAQMRDQFSLLKMENERLHKCIDNSASIKLYSENNDYS